MRHWSTVATEIKSTPPPEYARQVHGDYGTEKYSDFINKQTPVKMGRPSSKIVIKFVCSDELVEIQSSWSGIDIKDLINETPNLIESE
jgi:hypothetical protein